MTPETPSASFSHKPLAGPAAAVVNQMLVCYLDWREGAAAAAAAYRRWRDAPADEEARRYSLYVASVDQEESAATNYEQALCEVEHWLLRDDARPVWEWREIDDGLRQPQ